MKNLIAKAQTIINAPAENVWDALVDSQKNKEFMFGATVASDWKEGSAISWKGEMNGKEYEDKGIILETIPGKKLQYTHYSPLSGLPDIPEHHHTVTIELTEQSGKTAVTLTQGKNRSEEEQKESAKNWAIMLDSLKKVVER
ncbi:SRPBCC family protein [Parapedobacter sp. DT-150]|uniref:SRPBCC family protein n=1 Tax=Parapedobacter sp. DT-150 TaxID=3396162 RepID=UPI003F1C937C